MSVDDEAVFSSTNVNFMFIKCILIALNVRIYFVIYNFQNSVRTVHNLPPVFSPRVKRAERETGLPFPPSAEVYKTW
jgi:hypothetical protein